MKKRSLVILFISLFFSCELFSQADDYSGTWRVKYKPTVLASPIEIELKIASPEKNILYPAQLKLQCDSFKATYEILLVKKNLRQLGISRNKYAVSEEPSSIGNYTIVFNSTLDFSRDIKGDPQLTINRLIAKKYGVDIPDASKWTGPVRFIAAALKDDEIILKKINGIPWQHEDAEKILSPKLSPVYFGLKDTVHLQTRDGIINFSGNKKSSGDIISIILNGRTIIDQVEADKRKAPEEILLDTGLNILSFFADNFKKAAPNKAKIDLEFAGRKFRLDFTDKADIAATVITAKFYCDYDKDAGTRFRTNDLFSPADTSLKRNEKMIGNIVATSQTITLALWDDAVEDGDSVSININGKWITRGFPVKKNPQFLTVKLDPGPNMITFVADNLGSIPPNTSVLEIIDGKKRKSFTIETNLDQNNLIKIFYDFKPEN